MTTCATHESLELRNALVMYCFLDRLPRPAQSRRTCQRPHVAMHALQRAVRPPDLHTGRPQREAMRQQHSQSKSRLSSCDDVFPVIEATSARQ